MTAAALTPGAERQAEVIVVGAGPGGRRDGVPPGQRRRRRAAAGEDRVPARQGLRRRADARARSSSCVSMGIDLDAAGLAARTRACGSSAAGTASSCRGPTSPSYPTYGLVRARLDFDEILARHAAEGRRPAAWSAPTVTGPVARRAHRPDRRRHRQAGRRRRPQGRRRGHLPRAARGRRRRRLDPARRWRWASQQRDDRPMGVAVRTYYTSPRHDDDWLESWLELWDGEPGESNLLPGYGWIFGVGDGTVNVGLGILNTCDGVPQRRLQDLLQALARRTRPRSGASATRTDVGPIRGAALPMGFNRKPHYTRGVLLVGDAGGMVNPFNGEGIAYAHGVRARWPPRSIDAGARPPDGRRRASARCRATPTALDAALRRLLHARPGLREGDRQPDGDEAARPQYGLPAPDADAVRAQAAGQPHRPARRRRHGPASSTALTRVAPGGLTGDLGMTAARRQDATARRDDGRGGSAR